MPSSPVDEAHAAGYSDDEINTYLGPRMADALDQGYSQDEVNTYLGIKPPPKFDDGAVRQQLTTNLTTAKQPVTSFTDALKSGWDMSTLGLVARGKAPETELSPDAPWSSRIAYNLAEMTGDVPAMVAGFALGAGAGAETGPGAAITGTAGAFALPAALRGTLMDAYEKGQFTNFRDFWSRVAPIFIDTAKAYVTGAATGGAGKAVEAAGATIPGTALEYGLPGATAAAKTAAEIVAMTTVGKGLEGQVPTAQDFGDAAVMLFGLKAAEFGAGKLRAIYRATGVRPAEVVADAAKDVTIQQDLASPDKPIPDAYAAHVEPAFDVAAAEKAKLIAAGRPEAEAEQEAALVASHYEARAARFGGAKGTAGDLYRAELDTRGEAAKAEEPAAAAAEAAAPWDGIERRVVPPAEAEPPWAGIERRAAAPEAAATPEPGMVVQPNQGAATGAPEPVPPAEPTIPEPAETPPETTPAASGWVQENAASAVDFAKRLGLTERIGELARGGKTAKEISAAIGGKLDANEVRAVRDSLKIAPIGPSGFAFGPDIPRGEDGPAAAAAPTPEALYDEAQSLMKRLPADIGKARRDGKITPLMQQRLDRLDEIDKLLPSTGPEFQRILAERRAAYDAKVSADATALAATERDRLTQAGFAEGDKLFMQQPSFLPHIPGKRVEGVVRIGKNGQAYVSAGGKRLDPFSNPWQKAEAPEPPAAGAEGLPPNTPTSGEGAAATPEPEAPAEPTEAETGAAAAAAEPVPTKSWAPEVKVDGKWSRNATRFATEEEARKAAGDTHSRWMASEGFRATEADEPVNYRWDKDKGLVAVEPEPAPTSQSLVPPPPAEPAPVPESPHARAAERDHALAERIAHRLEQPNAEGVTPLSARELQSLAENTYGGTLASGAYSRDRLYDAMELGVNRYIQDHPERFSPAVDAPHAEQAARELAALKDSLPTQTVRAGEKDAYQQFSTPPDYAYAANWVANLRPDDHVIEPSAGVGGLIVHAMNAGVRETTVNELSDKRRGMIAALKPTRVTGEDAAQLHNILPADVRPTVVVMNPPFSRAAERMGGRMVLDEGAKHVEQMLARLEPGGRLVAIVGDGMKPEGTPREASDGGRRGGTGKAFADWWKKIGAEYDVRANVGVDRDIYTKYGTSFPTRLLVIDKDPPSGRPMVTGQAHDAAELIERLQDVRNERGADQPATDQSSRPEMVAGGEGVAGPDSELHSPTGGVGIGEGDRGDTPANVTEPAGAPQPGVSGGRPAGGGPAGSGGSEPVVPVKPQRGRGRAGGQPGGRTGARDDTGGGRDGGSRDGVRPDGSGERDEPGLTPAPEPVLATENAVSEPDNQAVNEAVYENYTPQRVQIVGAKKHPGALVQSAAMATVMPPATDYRPRIPAALVKSGALSDAQLESVVYAGYAHSDVMPGSGKGAEYKVGDRVNILGGGTITDKRGAGDDTLWTVKFDDGKVVQGTAPQLRLADTGQRRRGFFIGDGTGVGKGREIAGITLDNFQNGRRKAVWISEKRALVNDAKRDWSGLGRDASDVIDHGKMKPGDDIKADKGILFSSYDTLKSAEQTKTVDGKVRGKERVDQIIDWLGKDFDGVIAFDESHNMGNSIDTKGNRGVKKAALKALAGMRLQTELPNARVLYVSATGATEVSNLAYADRLGLWGEGTAFPTKQDFIGQVSSGGIAGMELVARDMKALGHYIARNLSYDGVDYDRVEHVLNADQRTTYDKLAEGWQLVLQHFNEALEESGATKDGKAKNPRAKSAAMSAFWGGHQRFFNQIITSMQMPSVIRGVEEDIKAGRQVVLQLVNTMEAAQERALEKARATGGGEIEDLDMTPRDQLMQLIEKSYPVQQMEDYVDDNGNIRSRPTVDSEGKPVVNKELVARRDKLLDQIGSIRVPDGPLEMLMNHFGTDKVAEVTGRKQRVVRKPDETGQMKTVVEHRGASANLAEASSFQAGKKPILVFSEAGGTGRSYHAEIGSGSEDARRSHYLVQGGWRADKAVQGFGRTHRTNQASAPIFHLVTTDLQGQKRFISSIARRLAQLGALTKGERRAADQGMFGMRDNLESTEARDGLTQFFKDVNAGQVDGVSMDDLEKSMGLKMRDENGAMVSPLPEMSQFLNRVLSLKVDHQNQVFNAFSDRMDLAISRASAAGTLDTGVETYKADKISKLSEQTVYTDPRSGAETKHVHLNAQNRNVPVSFADTLAGRNKTNGAKPDTFIQNNRSGGVFAVTAGGNYTDEDGRIVPQVRLTSPIDYQFADREKIDRDNWKKVSVADAKPLWDAQVAATPEFRNSDLHLITGAVLPIWDRLGGSPKIFRLQTDQGERMLGRVVPATRVDATLQRLGAEGIKVTATPAEIAQRVLNGATARLANDWTIKRSLVAGEPRIEVVGPDYRHGEELARSGVFSERIPYATRYFIPTEPQAAAAAIEGITKSRPVTALEGGDRTLYQRDEAGTPKGRIDLSDGRAVITIMRDAADASTPIHEYGHAWLDELMRDAADPQAPQQLTSDAQTVRAWLGAGEGELTDAQHEHFADSFVQFLRDGQAPSSGLARVFAQFRQWLAAIYQHVEQLGVPISPEVRAVFGRMVGTDEEAPGAEPPGPPAEPPAAPGHVPATIDEAKSLILSHLSVGEAAPTRPWTFARLYTDAVNKLFPIEQAVTHAAGTDVLPAAEDAGKLARLMSGASGIADRFLRYNTLDFATRQPNGPGLETILAPVRDDMDGFRAYAAAQRALELEEREIPTGFDLDAARMVATEGVNRYGETLTALIDFQNRTATYLRDAGVLSGAGYDAMREANQLYVPFQRVMEADASGAIRLTGGGSLEARNPIKGIRGSQRAVIDPIESIIRNTYLFTQMAERNVVGTKLIDMLTAGDETEPGHEAAADPAAGDALRAEGIADPEALEPLLASLAPVREGEIRILRDGRAATYKVDPELARAMKGLDAQSMGDLERMLRPFANALRAGAVLQPDFVLRHSIRDFLYAAVTHPGFFSPLDLVRGFTSLAIKDADYQDWLSSGGAQVSMVSLDRRYLQHSIEQLTGTGILERAWNVVGDADTGIAAKAGAVAKVPLDAARKFLLNPMQMAVQFAESATHIGAFIKAKNAMLADQPEGTQLTREQTLEAGFASRDVAVDAARMGAKIRTLNALSAFSNIVIQDTDRVARAFVKSPMATAIKVAGVISLPSVLTWINGNGDPRYDDAPDWERDLFWVLPHDHWKTTTAKDYGAQPDDPHLRRRTDDGLYQVNDGAVFRIPKPWGMGLIFGSGVERSLDSFAAHKPGAFKSLMSSLGTVALPSLIPNAFTPIIEQFANRSTFTNRTLVPDQMEKLLPEYQYTPYTTETAKALGQIVGAFPGVEQARTEQGIAGGVARALSTPILMENYLRAWTGNLGMYALQLADTGLRKTGVVPDPPNMPASTLADIPFVRAFVVRSPTSSAQSIQDFQDEYARNKIYYDTMLAMAKDGNQDAVQRIQQAGGPAMLVQLDGMHTALGEQSRIVRDIYKNPAIPSDEKRQLIDTIYWRMSEIAHAGTAAQAQARGVTRP